MVEREKSKCKLCGSTAKVLQSHIIPKFVIAWIRKTAATGYIRQGIKPNLRLQDIHKVKLLCANCEERFSRAESRFAKEIFVPFQESLQRDGPKKQLEGFKYGDWLLFFAVSLAWRTVVVDDELPRRKPELASCVHSALDCWRDFLLGNTTDPGPYAHHLLFVGFSPSVRGVKTSDMLHLNWYIMRSVDATPVFTHQGEAYAYTKLPGIVFWSGIQPPEPRGWSNTRIFQEGEITFPRQVSDPRFRGFFLSHAQEVAKMSAMSTRQQEKIKGALPRNRQRVLASHSLGLYWYDAFVWQKEQGSAE